MQLTARVGLQKTVVVIANKNTRIVWAALTRDTAFEPDHLRRPPPASGGVQLQAAR